MLRSMGCSIGCWALYPSAMIRTLKGRVRTAVFRLALAALAVFFDVAVARAQTPRAADLTLSGTLTGAAHQTYA